MQAALEPKLYGDQNALIQYTLFLNSSQEGSLRFAGQFYHVGMLFLNNVTFTIQANDRLFPFVEHEQMLFLPRQFPLSEQTIPTNL